MIFRREYLGRFPGADEMSDAVKVADEATKAPTYVPACRHCKKERGQHIVGQCPFDYTSWEPMTEEEWALFTLEMHIIKIKKNMNQHTHSTTTGRLASNPPFLRK